MTLDKHDYIGKSDASSMENCEKKCVLLGENEGKNKGLNFKATELRLGLPGSESPERENGAEVESKNGCPVWVVKGLVSGAKRGFSDTTNNGVCGQWLFTGSGGSEVDLGKGDVLFSPKGVHAPVKAIDGVESGIPQSFMAGKELRVASTVGKEPVVQSCSKQVEEKNPQVSALKSHGIAPASKAQVVGWPPVRSFRKNSMAINSPKSDEDANTKMGNGCLYIKVSMDGAPYLRKVDLKTYKSYKDLSSALEKMFSCFTIGQCGSHGVHIQDGISESGLVDLLHGSEYVLTYEDKDGDWMLVGDVPWNLFTDSCKRLRIMKSSDAVGLGKRQGKTPNPKKLVFHYFTAFLVPCRESHGHHGISVWSSAFMFIRSLLVISHMGNSLMISTHNLLLAKGLTPTQRALTAPAPGSCVEDVNQESSGLLDWVRSYTFTHTRCSSTNQAFGLASRATPTLCVSLDSNS